MPTWLRRVRGVLGMGLTWAIGGAGVGGVIELLDNVLPGGLDFASRVDMWPQTLAIPGFVSGVLFASVLMLVGRRLRSDTLSRSRFIAVGAVAGAMLGALAMTIGAPLLFVGVTTLWGVLAASGSLFFANRAKTRDLLGHGDDGLPATIVAPDHLDAPRP